MSEEAFTEGAVWYTSWGYDQTNVEFFQVVKRNPRSIVLRRIASEWKDGRTFPVPGQFIRDFHLEGNPGTSARLRDEARGYSEKLCMMPRPSKRDGWTPSGVTIDYCRTAWPYEGGGQYDTAAAGLPGH